MNDHFVSLALTTPVRSVSTTRHTLHGRDHIVVPVVALVGDIAIAAMGGRGREFVPGHVLAASTKHWNGRPVIFDHPNQSAVTANTPEIINSISVGTIFNARYEDNRLKADLYLDMGRDAIGDPDSPVLARIHEALLNDTPLEVSIGATVGAIQQRGVDSAGRVYDYVWTHILPDHLAILPVGQPGACSVAMGCGTPRAAAAVELDAVAVGNQLLVEESAMDLTNLKSVRSKLRDLLYKAFLFDLGKSADVFNFADATAPASPSSEINVTEETVTPVGDAAPVLPAIGDVLATVAASAIPLSQDLSSTTGGVEPSSAQPVAASSEEPAAPTNTQGGECMCTTASLAGRLIANAAAPFTEEQRASLEALGEATLTSLAAQYEPPVPVTPATPTPAATETQVAASAPVNRQLSEAEFLAICPDNYRTVLLAAQHARETNRANLLTQLSGKVGLPDTSLQAMSDNDLQALANAWRGANPQVTGLQGVPVPPQLVGLSDADRKVYTNPPDPWNLQARIAAAGTARQTAGLPSTGGN